MKKDNSIWNKMPIQKGEWLKFCAMSSMIAFIIYVYSILRVSKDTIIVSLVGQPELISTLKFYAVLPSAVILILVYTKLVNYLSRIQMFYTITWFFISFFVLFNFVLFPNADHIHPNLDAWSNAIPQMKYIFLMISNWSYTLFFIFSEAWGSMMISLIFWQFANQTVSMSEAKRFYPLFGLVGQFGLLASSNLIQYFTKSAAVSGAISSQAKWGHVLNDITYSIIISGISLSLIFLALIKLLGSDLINAKVSISGKVKKKKAKMGMIESLRYIASSKYIGLITALIICYGVTINLVENLWKKTMGVQFPNPNDYMAFNGKLQNYTAVFTMIAMLFGSFLLRRIKWKTAALLTPIVIAVTGVLFFVFVVFQDQMNHYVAYTGITALLISVLMGAAQNILSKSVKYSFFDPTKEMAYIPLDDELKVKGKAAADVIGGRLGKSGGALIQASVLQFFVGSTLFDIAPYMFIVFIAISVVWFISVSSLSVRFEQTQKDADSVPA